jgi:EmrB/QacA subfamily drug resistance transporter
MSFIDRYRPWLVLCGMGIVGMIVNIDFTIVNTVLPTIQKDLNATVGQLQWMMSAFGITFATLLAISGRIADLYGRRLIAYIAMTGFLLTSIGAALSTTPRELIVFRFLQGLFGAATFPCAISLVAEAFPEKNRGKAMGIFAALAGIGLAIGPVLGGLIVSFASWRYVFYINVPVILLSFLICIPSVKESKKQVKEEIDWLSLILFIIGFGLIVFAITEAPNLGWLSPWTIGLFILGLILFGWFLYKENQSKIPLIPFHTFRNRSFLIGIGVCIGAMAPAWAFFFLAPLYLQNVLNYSPGATGLILIAMTAMTVITPPIAGTWLDKKGPKPVVTFLFICTIIAFFLELFFQVYGPLWLILISFILFGIGWGIGNSCGIALSIADLPSSEDTGVASGSAITILNVYGVLVLSIVGTLFRHFEATKLHHFLQRSGININPSQEHQVRATLSDPSKAGDFLSPDLATQVISHFKQSFMSGYHIAIGVLFALSTLIFLLTLYVLSLKKKKIV